MSGASSSSTDQTEAVDVQQVDAINDDTFDYDYDDTDNSVDYDDDADNSANDNDGVVDDDGVGIDRWLEVYTLGVKVARDHIEAAQTVEEKIEAVQRYTTLTSQLRHFEQIAELLKIPKTQTTAEEK